MGAQNLPLTSELSPANPLIFKKWILEREVGMGGRKYLSVASHMYPYGGSNLQPRYVHRMMLQPSHAGQGFNGHF